MCPKCKTRKESLRVLQGHWFRVHISSGTMPFVASSARKKHVLDPNLKFEFPPKTIEKKKMTPQEQREDASSKAKHSHKALPQGWTREKVARAYSEAPSRGCPKGVWLESWNKKYDFPLCHRKVGVWVKKFIKMGIDENSDAEESSIESD